MYDSLCSEVVCININLICVWRIKRPYPACIPSRPEMILGGFLKRSRVQHMYGHITRELADAVCRLRHHETVDASEVRSQHRAANDILESASLVALALDRRCLAFRRLASQGLIYRRVLLFLRHELRLRFGRRPGRALSRSTLLLYRRDRHSSPTRLVRAHLAEHRLQGDLNLDDAIGIVLRDRRSFVEPFAGHGCITLTHDGRHLGDAGFVSLILGFLLAPLLLGCLSCLLLALSLQPLPARLLTRRGNPALLAHFDRGSAPGRAGDHALRGSGGLRRNLGLPGCFCRLQLRLPRRGASDVDLLGGFLLDDVRRGACADFFLERHAAANVGLGELFAAALAQPDVGDDEVAYVADSASTLRDLHGVPDQPQRGVRIGLEVGELDVSDLSRLYKLPRISPQLRRRSVQGRRLEELSLSRTNAPGKPCKLVLALLAVQLLGRKRCLDTGF